MSGADPLGSTSTRRRTSTASAICFEHGVGDDRERVRLNRGVDPSDPESITASEPDARMFDARLPELPFAGSGERRDTCGEEIPRFYCDDCGSPTWVGQSCRRSRCPRCWQAWDFDRALDAAQAVDSTRRYQHASGDDAKAHHMTLSAPAALRFDSADPLDAGFAVAKHLLAEMGANDGVLIYHPYRIAEEHRGEVNGHDSGDGDMRWKDVLAEVENPETTFEDVRDEYLVYSPHFHAIVAADWIETEALTDELYDKTGWVVHRITGGDSPVSLYGANDLARATAYSLSHAGLTRNKTDESFQAAYRKIGRTANIDRTDPNNRIETALREVSNNVLGVDFRRGDCREDVATAADANAVADADPNPDASNTPPAVRSLATSGGGTDLAEGGSSGGGADNDWPDTSGFGGGNTGGFATGTDTGAGNSWTASTGVSPDWLDDPSEADDDLRETCGGQLRPIWEAPDRLADDEWCDRVGARRVTTLADALDEWREQAVKTPPDAPDDPPPD